MSWLKAIDKARGPGRYKLPEHQQQIEQVATEIAAERWPPPDPRWEGFNAAEFDALNADEEP